LSIPTLNLHLGITPCYIKILSTYDWSCSYSIASVDDAVTSLSAIVQDAMEQVIPHGFIGKSVFPHLFLGSLQHYVSKRNTVTDILQRTNQTVFTVNFPSILS
jgi:hypothetical protein